MSMIKDVKTLLISKGVSTTIYLGLIPDSTAECIGLYRYAGQPPILPADIERIGLQVRCRAETYEEALLNSKLVCSILSEVGDEDTDGGVIEIDGTKYIRIVPMQSGFSSGGDGETYEEIVQNFGVYTPI